MREADTKIQVILEVVELPFVHCGGAWKVAYADFMTAMMAFFLLMWLLNMTPMETKEQLADYFDPGPPMASSSNSGAGGTLGGLTMSPEGSRASDQNPHIPLQTTKQRKRGEKEKSEVNQVEKTAEKKRFETIANKIKRALLENKKLEKFKDNVEITITPEGLRIEIIDQEDESMFPSGSANMFEKTRELLGHITDVIIEMPNELSIRGHTDGMRYSQGAIYTNWELSADRANAVRRAVLDAGFPDKRLHDVMGKADTTPLVEDNPLDPRNRRITLIMLNQEFPDAPDEAESEDGLVDGSELLNKGNNEPVSPYSKTPGVVEFP
jgi:chemotaxis protein MotB